MQRIKYISKNIKHKIKSLAIISTSAILLMPAIASADTFPVQQFTDPAPQPGDFFGYSVSIAAVDQNTAVVGAPNVNSNGIFYGAAYVFTKNVDGTWTSVAQLQPINSESFNFGNSVSIDSTADQIVVGANDETNNTSGSAFIFNKPIDGWASSNPIYQTSQLNYSGEAGDHFGESVSQSSDGSTVIVGAPQPNDLSLHGNAYIYTRLNATFNQTAHLNALDFSNDFGWSVALSNDGSSAYIGAPASNVHSSNGHSVSGSIYVFNSVNNNWSDQQQNASINDPVNCEINQFSDCTSQGDGPSHVNGEFDSFGSSISANGNNLVVGAPNFYSTNATDSDGAAFTFSFDSNSFSWNQTNNQKPIVDPIETNYDQFGHSVGYAADGSSIYIGSPNSSVNGNLNEGNVYQYLPDANDTSIWNLTNNYIPSSDGANQDFGWSVFAINTVNNQNQNDMFVGAPAFDETSSPQSNTQLLTNTITSPNTKLSSLNTQPSSPSGGKAYLMSTTAPLNASPNSGGVGATITISGIQNLSKFTSVKFGGVSTTIKPTINSANSISAIVPTGAKTGLITVTTPTGNYSTSTNFTVLSTPVAQVTSINPTAPGEGMNVTINGKYLAKASVILVGQNNNQPIKLNANDNGHIAFTVPKNAVSGPLSITTPSGTVTINFTVSKPVITGESGAIKAGSTITLNGHFLGGIITASFANTNGTSTIQGTIKSVGNDSVKVLCPVGVFTHGTIKLTAFDSTYYAQRTY